MEPDIQPTTLVRLKRRAGVVVTGCDVYIGRRCTMGGWDLPQSRWANPFTIAQCGGAEVAVARYAEYLRSRPDLMAAVPTLRGKVLGCWCTPGPCHGDVLLALANRGSA